MEFLMELVNPTQATLCFIVAMITLPLQQLCFVRNIRKFWEVLIEIVNGCIWLITACVCVILLYEGLHTGMVHHQNVFHNFTPLITIMYVVRVLASFIISGVSFDLASHRILGRE